MKLNELSKDKLDKLASFKTDEEIKAFIENEDIELDPEQLAAVSGGAGSGYACKYCGKSFSGQFAPFLLMGHMASHPEYVAEIKEMLNK